MSHLLANLFKFNQRYYPSDDELSLLIPALKKYFAYPERHQMKNTITEDLSVTLKKISPHWTQRLIRIWFNNNKHQYLLSNNIKKISELGENEAVLLSKKIINSGFNIENQNFGFNINNSQNQKESFQFSDQPQKLALSEQSIIDSSFNKENQNFDFNINNSQNQKESFQFSDQPQKLALSEQSIIDSSFNKENQNIDFNINNSQNQKESFQFSDQPQKLALSEQSIIDSSFNKENQNIDFNINNSQNHIKALQISRESIYISTPYDAMSESIYSEHVKKIKKFQLQLNNLNAKIDKLERKYNGLESKYKQEISKYRNFFEKYKDIENAEPQNQSSKEILGSELIKKYLKNVRRKPRGWRYTSNIYDFCKILQNISSKCYEILREIYILPTIDSLNKRYLDEEKRLRKLIKDINSIPILIDMYKNIYNIESEIESIISIDAASLDRPNKHSHSHVFVIYLQPLNPKYKCFPIHIHSKVNGNCDEDVINLIDQTIGLLKESGISVKAVASDGDPGYNERSQTTFDKYINIFKKKGFYSAVEYIMNSNEVFFILDLLHIIKLARKRIIKAPITISTSLKSTFSKESLDEILNLGNILNDESSLGYMKDFYPMKLFSISNVLKLYQEHKYNEFLYFFPFGIWIEAIMSPSLTKKSRLYLLRIAFYIFYSFLVQYQKGEFDQGITIYNSKNSKAQCFNSYNFIIRCLNTVIITYSLMIKLDEIALDRISSHPVENYFGYVRMMSHDFDSYDNFIRIAVDSIMNLILCNKLQIHQKVKGRINIAGAKVEEESGLYDIDDELCEDLNVVLCSFIETKQSIEVFAIEPKKEDFNLFLTILTEYSSQYKTAAETIYESKAMSGQHIISRCKGVKIEKKKNQDKSITNDDEYDFDESDTDESDMDDDMF